MMCYCIYVALFAAAAYLGPKASHAQMVLFSIGSCNGGLAAGMLWTAQGGYFARTVDLLSRLENAERATLSAELASTFAFIYLGCEVCAKLCWTALDLLGMDDRVTAFIYAAI